MSSSSSPSPSSRPSPRMRSVVIGLGPAGRIAAHRAAARGWDVLGLDPAGGSMPSTVGAWEHQLPGWLPTDAVASRFRPEVVTSDGSRRLLDDAYAILDTARLSDLGGFRVRRDLGVAGEGPTVSLLGPDGQYRDDEDVSADEDFGDYGAWVNADVVVDAVGATADAPQLAARQLAVGHVFSEDDVPPHLRVPVLMDFTVPRGAETHGEFIATFSYRVPLGDGTWLIEETVVAARSTARSDDPRRAAVLDHLRRMQTARLADLGIDPGSAVAEEVVDFPMGPRRLPGNRPRTPGHGHFGAAAGWMHPASGYSVGAVLADVDRYLDRLAAREDASPPGGRLLAWLRRRGLHVLLGFGPDHTRIFFDAFFTLPDPAIREYLTGTSAPKTMGVMARLAVPLARKDPAALLKLLATFVDGKPVARS